MGQAVFAGTLIGLGVLGLAQRDFAPVWQPVPDAIPARQFLAYACALVFLSCGIGVLWPRTGRVAARVLLGYLVLWFATFRLASVVRAPLSQEAWSGAGESLVYVAGAWSLLESCGSEWDRRHVPFGRGARSTGIAARIYGFALIPFGVAHFRYIHETASLVPAWLPAHMALAYLTGATFIAAGLAILIGAHARAAAGLSALQMGFFTLLVWVPVALSGPDAFQWSEFVISWTLTAAAWVVADSLRAARAPVYL